MAVSVTLKLATSLDGRIATASGESQWITGEAARTEGHRLRAAHDAVLAGIGTVLADNPKLTARTDPPAQRQPLRVVLDTHARTPPTAAIVRSACANAPSLILVGLEAPEAAIGALSRVHVEVARVAVRDGRVDAAAALAAIAARGAASVLIEGGGQVAAAFLRAGLVDRIAWFRAPILLGEEGRPAIGPLGLAALADAPGFERVAVRDVGPDLWESYVKR